MAKSVGIIAYGTVEDRAKLEALSSLGNDSGSAWIIAKIRSEYDRIFSRKDEVDRGLESNVPYSRDR